MALAEIPTTSTGRPRNLGDVYKTGLGAIEKLAEAERLRAEAIADLVDFDTINGHLTAGYLTPQRHMIHKAGVADHEANRIHRLIRFCQTHPLIADQLAQGLITVEHADAP